MLKSPLQYPGGKSRAVETIAKLLPDFDEFREPFLGGEGSVFVCSNDLKSHIFITAGEHSVACGRKNTRNYCLKGRTDKVLPIRANGEGCIALVPQTTIKRLKF